MVSDYLRYLAIGGGLARGIHQKDRSEGGFLNLFYPLT